MDRSAKRHDEARGLAGVPQRDALLRRCGQLEAALDQLPHDIRDLLEAAFSAAGLADRLDHDWTQRA
ncbi:hypothetical protein ACWGI0_28770 [Streptomyces sp. NPDC054802]